MNTPRLYIYPGVCQSLPLTSEDFYLFDSDSASGFYGARRGDDGNWKRGVRPETPEDRTSYQQLSDMSLPGNISTIFRSRAFDL